MARGEGEKLEVVGLNGRGPMLLEDLEVLEGSAYQVLPLKSITPGPPREPRVITIVTGATTVFCLLGEGEGVLRKSKKGQKCQSTSLKTRTSNLEPRTQKSEIGAIAVPVVSQITCALRSPRKKNVQTSRLKYEK